MGYTEKVVGVCILLLLAGILVTFVTQVATNKEYLFEVDEAAYGIEPANPFPNPGVQGWQAPPEASRFTPDNLYLKINGRADAYLQFNVVGLTFGVYSHQTDSDRAVDVYWYDMGEPANAFDMYRSEVPPEISKVALGREGYQTGGAVFFWKGSSYVQVLPASFDEADADVVLKIAERLSEAIKDEGIE